MTVHAAVPAGLAEQGTLITAIVAVVAALALAAVIGLAADPPGR